MAFSIGHSSNIKKVISDSSQVPYVAFRHKFLVLPHSFNDAFFGLEKKRESFDAFLRIG